MMIISGVSPAPPAAPGRATELMARARALEAQFLSQMLGHANLGKTSESFGGGIGEEQFASFLRDEQAAAMVRQGGLGLAEQVFRVLSEQDHAR